MTDGRLPFTEGVGRRSLAALLMLAMAFALSPLAAQAEGRLNMTVLEGTNNVAAALSWSKFTYTTANDAIIGRDDLSPDNLSSGMVQGLLAAPLLLTGSSTLNADVKAELTRLGVRTVHILGGTGAISSSVESALKADGYSVRRYSGKSRIETAVAVAEQFGGSAATGFLSRAFGSGADETGTWADALGGGAWSAQTGWPVLLSQSDTLTPATRTYIQGSRLRKIIILGGTSAISAAAEAQVQALGVTTERVSGANRFATATAIATKRGFSTAAAATNIVLADGQNTNAWAAGFAAAGYAASGKPIVLSNAGALPTETDSWFAGGTSAKNLIVAPFVVEAASTAAANKLSLLKKAAVTLDATSFANNSNITGKVAPKDDVTSTSVSGACVATTTLTLAASTGAFSVPITNNFAPGSCALTFTTTYSNSSTQTDALTVTIVGPGPNTTGMDGPELTNVTLFNTTDDHVVLKYTFDEPITIVDTTKFKLVAFDGTVLAPDAPGDDVRPDLSDTKSALSGFKKQDYLKSTVAAVEASAVRGTSTQVNNPEGHRQIQSVSFAAGRTVLPDLESVSAPQRVDRDTSSVVDYVVHVTFNFDIETTSQDTDKYLLMAQDGTWRNGGSFVSGDGTKNHVIEFGTNDQGDSFLTDETAANTYRDSIRRARVDAGAVQDRWSQANVQQTVASGTGTVDVPRLTSVDLLPDSNQVRYTFAANVFAPNKLLFFVYNHLGTKIDVTAAGSATATDAVVLVTFSPSGTIDEQVTAGGTSTAAVNDTSGGGGMDNEIQVLPASNGAETFSSGETLSPDLQKVIRAPESTDPFGGGAVSKYKVTFRFDNDVTALDATKLLMYSPSGTATNLSAATCNIGTTPSTKVDIVCEVADSHALFNTVKDAVVFAVQAGAVKSDGPNLVYNTYPSSKLPAAS